VYSRSNFIISIVLALKMGFSYMSAEAALLFEVRLRSSKLCSLVCFPWRWYDIRFLLWRLIPVHETAQRQISEDRNTKPRSQQTNNEPSLFSLNSADCTVLFDLLHVFVKIWSVVSFTDCCPTFSVWDVETLVFRSAKTGTVMLWGPTLSSWKVLF
jgi:hypothetical protein